LGHAGKPLAYELSGVAFLGLCPFALYQLLPKLTRKGGVPIGAFHDILEKAAPPDFIT